MRSKIRLDQIDEKYGEDLADAVKMALNLYEDEDFSQEDFVRAAMFSMPTGWLKEVVEGMNPLRQ